MIQKIPITKLDAAERQLREATMLLFEGRDPIAIHTLASAASQVTADLLEAKGLKSILRSGGMIKAERRREVLKVMASPENFFKHAERDASKTLEVNPEFTPF